MCDRCIAEDALPRRRFLRIAATGAVAIAAGASFDTRVAEAKPTTDAGGETSQVRPGAGAGDRHPGRSGVPTSRSATHASSVTRRSARSSCTTRRARTA